MTFVLLFHAKALRKQRRKGISKFLCAFLFVFAPLRETNAQSIVQYVLQINDPIHHLKYNIHNNPTTLLFSAEE